MDDLLTLISDMGAFATPTGRNKKKGGEGPVVPFSSLILFITLFIVVAALIFTYIILKIDIKDFLVPAIILGLVAWLILYIIIVNIADVLYIRHLKKTQIKKA